MATKTFITSPYHDTGKRDSDVTAHPWPLATRSLLADHERLAAAHEPVQLNQPLFALIRARKALKDAELMSSFARRCYPGNASMHKALTAVITALQKAHREFPLSVAGE